jgi:hypothetical protein
MPFHWIDIEWLSKSFNWMIWSSSVDLVESQLLTNWVHFCFWISTFPSACLYFDFVRDFRSGVAQIYVFLICIEWMMWNPKEVNNLDINSFFGIYSWIIWNNCEFICQLFLKIIFFEFGWKLFEQDEFVDMNLKNEMTCLVYLSWLSNNFQINAADSASFSIKESDNKSHAPSFVCLIYFQRKLIGKRIKLWVDHYRGLFYQGTNKELLNANNIIILCFNEPDCPTFQFIYQWLSISTLVLNNVLSSFLELQVHPKFWPGRVHCE